MSRPRFLADHDLKFEIIQRTIRRQPASTLRSLCGFVDLKVSQTTKILRFAGP